MDDHYITSAMMHGTTIVCFHNEFESLIHTSSLRRDKSITSKVTSPLGYLISYLMDFVLLSLVTQRSNVLSGSSLEYQLIIAKKDNSYPFRTGIN